MYSLMQRDKIVLGMTFGKGLGLYLKILMTLIKDPSFK
jgi:hypothetical protein